MCATGAVAGRQLAVAQDAADPHRRARGPAFACRPSPGTRPPPGRCARRRRRRRRSRLAPRPLPSALRRLPLEHLERRQAPVRAHDAAAGMRGRAVHPEPVDRRSVARVARYGTIEEELLQRQLTLEDVALGEPELALDVLRRQHLLVQDEAADVRGAFLDRVEHRLAERVPRRIVPFALGQVVGRVLHEAAHDVLAGRRHRRVDERRDDHVDVRPAAEPPVLGVVVGPLHVVERRAEADRAPRRCSPAPGRQVKSGRPSSARFTFPDDPRNL